jgi:hypothetical protein
MHQNVGVLGRRSDLPLAEHRECQLEPGKFGAGVSAHYKSGYQDQSPTTIQPTA